MGAKKPWTWCREIGCDTKIIFAARNGRALPYEHTDRAPFSIEATGAHVLISGQTFTPREAIEDFQTRLGIAEDKARELVSGYPFHRLHLHERADAPSERQEQS
jgi:hypothetical protein